MSKGSGRRPAQVDAATFQNNWDRIFSGRGVTVSTSGSNPLSSGSNPDAPANLPDAQSMDAPIYVDDATGRQVSEDWWPGDEHVTP